MHIYVENFDALPQIFCVTEQMVRKVLPDEMSEAQITVRKSDELNVSLLETADFLIGSHFNTQKIANHGANLKIVHCLIAGVEALVPLDWLPDGAVFTNSSGIHAEKSANFGAMAISMLNEHIPQYATDQRKRLWKPALTTRLEQKTVLIYGFGSIGQAIALKLRELGMKVLGVRRSAADHEAADEIHEPDRLHQVLPKVDFLILCCPLTKETRGVIGEHELGLLPRGAGVLNIARGPVLDNRALAVALESGHLSGAIIDVFESEPLPSDSWLWEVPNLIILPHVSCEDPDGYIERSISIFGDNLRRLRAGQTLRNVVDKQLEY